MAKHIEFDGRIEAAHERLTSGARKLKTGKGIDFTPPIEGNLPLEVSKGYLQGTPKDSLKTIRGYRRVNLLWTLRFPQDVPRKHDQIDERLSLQP